MSRLPIVLFLLAAASADAAGPLTLAEALQIALERDPIARQADARAASYAQDAVADSALPDPELMVGIGERPLGAPAAMSMSMYEVGVMQRIPSGATRRSLAERGNSLADAERLAAVDRRLELSLQLTRAWIEALHMLEAVDAVDRMRDETAVLAETASSRHARGAARRGEVVAVELELARLHERANRARRALDDATAELARLVGPEHGARPLARAVPASPVTDAGALRAGLTTHPRVRAATARVDAGRAEESAARGTTRPEFTLSASYMRRTGALAGMDMPDAMAARASVSVPLFTANRQDRRIAAATARVNEANAARDDALYALEYLLDRAVAAEREALAQKALYESRVLPSLAELRETAENAYRAGAGDVTDVLRARIAELDAHQEHHGITLELQHARAELLYLAGENR